MIYLQLFLEFFKVGLFCFGGAFGMIPLIEETVVNHGWLTEAEFFNLIGVCESTPGPIAINTATFVGYRVGGILGAILATMGVVLPSFVIITVIAFFLRQFQDYKGVQYAFWGIRAGVLALILKALWSMYKSAPKGWVSYVVMAAAFILAAFFDINILFIIIGCAVFGLVTSMIAARRVKQ